MKNQKLENLKSSLKLHQKHETQVTNNVHNSGRLFDINHKADFNIYMKMQRMSIGLNSFEKKDKVGGLYTPDIISS